MNKKQILMICVISTIIGVLLPIGLEYITYPLPYDDYGIMFDDSAILTMLIYGLPIIIAMSIICCNLIPYLQERKLKKEEI